MNTSMYSNDLSAREFIIQARDDLAKNRYLPQEEKVARDIETMNAIRNFLVDSKDNDLQSIPLQVVDNALDDIVFEDDEEDGFEHIYDYAESLEDFFDSILANPNCSWEMHSRLSANLLEMFGKDTSDILNESKRSDWVPPAFYGLGNSSRILPSKGEEKES